MLVHCQVLLDGSFIYLFFNGTYAVFDVPGTSIKKKKKGQLERRKSLEETQRSA